MFSPALVFDLGGVLLDWRPRVFVESLMPGIRLNANERDWLIQGVFQDYGPSSDWVAFDLNRLELGALCARIAQRLSGSADRTDRLLAAIPTPASIEAWIGAVADRLQPLEASVDWLHSLRREGLPLYYLSNMPRLFIPKVLRHRKVFDCFEKGVFSGEVNLAKPDPAIFALAAERFSHPSRSDTIFFDDHPANVAAARSFGWQSIHFDSLESAQLQYKQLLASRMP